MSKERTAQPMDVWLRTFLAVADASSVTDGAEVVGLSQPTVSQYVRQLEESLGVALFERHGRGVTLTAAGARLRQRVSAAYGTIDSAVGEVSRGEGVIRGTVRVASAHTLNAYFLAPVLGEFCEQRPEAGIQVLCRGSTEIVELVERGRVDLGLVYDAAVASADVESIALFEERMALVHREADVLPSSAGVELDERVRLLAFPAGYALRRLLDHHYRGGLHIVAEVETMDAMLQLVRAGVGAAVLPDSLPHTMVEAQGLARSELATPVPRRRVVVIRRRNTASTPLTRLVEDLICVRSAALAGSQ